MSESDVKEVGRPLGPLSEGEQRILEVVRDGRTDLSEIEDSLKGIIDTDKLYFAIFRMVQSGYLKRRGRVYGYVTFDLTPLGEEMIPPLLPREAELRAKYGITRPSLILLNAMRNSHTIDELSQATGFHDDEVHAIGQSLVRKKLAKDYGLIRTRYKLSELGERVLEEFKDLIS